MRPDCLQTLSRSFCNSGSSRMVTAEDFMSYIVSQVKTLDRQAYRAAYPDGAANNLYAVPFSTKECYPLFTTNYAGYHCREGAMCFVLYAGTSKLIPRKEWRKDAPDLSVQKLTERENPITTHFSTREVQYIGSTSECGCDFAHVMFQNGEWPWFNSGEHDPEEEARDRYNRQALVSLLRATGDQTVELYGV